jgi:predicted ABC-type ATPase
MMHEPPSVVVIAGPNGAGKSTIAPRVLQCALAVTEFVNADVIARGLSAFNPEAVAVAAGRIMLERLRDLAAQRVSFAFETTLASRSFAPWIRSLIESGYDFHLVYVWVESAEFSVQRVAGRVARGGHHVPEEIVRRRYVAGLRNFFELYRPLAKNWRVYDNSRSQLRLIAFGSGNDVLGVEDAATWSRIEGTGRTWREVTMAWEAESRITKIMLDGKTVLETARQGVREALLDRARAGLASVVSENGEIRWIPPDEMLRWLAEEPVSSEPAKTRIDA